MKRTLLVALPVALYALHQDFWFWRTAEPLVFGFLPVGLFYHACYSVAAAGLMWILVRYSWPAHLEEQVERDRAGKPRPEEGSAP
jgi:hypothetical protein